MTGTASRPTECPEIPGAELPGADRDLRAGAARGWAARLGRTGASRLGAAIAALWMPPECVHCGEDRWKGLPLCRACHRSLALWRDGATDGYAALAARERRFLFTLSPALSTLIHGFKYHNRRRHAAYLCARARHRADLAAWAAGFDALVPVPIHPVRRRERGYNQAETIAGGLSRLWGRPMLPSALSRRRATTTQTRLSKGERGSNLAGAFSARADGVKGKRLLLVDDVYTTGATTEACAAALLRAGASEVAVFALAKVEPGSPEGDFVREMEAAAAYAA